VNQPGISRNVERHDRRCALRLTERHGRGTRDLGDGEGAQYACDSGRPGQGCDSAVTAVPCGDRRPQWVRARTHAGTTFRSRTIARYSSSVRRAVLNQR
jgi:hypothetical protein